MGFWRGYQMLTGETGLIRRHRVEGTDQMSLEQALAENTAAITEQTAAIRELIEITKKSNDIRQAVVAQVTESLPAPSTRGRRPKAAESAESGAETAAAPEAEKPAAAAPAKAEISVDDVASAFKNYLGDTDDVAEREKRKAFIVSCGEHFGARPTEVPAEKRGELMFYLERQKAGLPVVFGGAYDFDGDPKQSLGGAASDDDGI